MHRVTRTHAFKPYCLPLPITMPEPTASTIAVTSEDPKKKKQEDVENKDKVDDKKVKDEKEGEELVSLNAIDY